MNTDLDELRSQVAIVTGAGRGLGRAIALALARAGARVGVVARSEEQLAETVGGVREAGAEALAVVTDVSDPAAVERMARQVERTLGPADLLVNNAGTTGPLGPMWEADLGEWWHSIEVNLRGPYLLTRLPARNDRAPPRPDHQSLHQRRHRGGGAHGRVRHCQDGAHPFHRKPGCRTHRLRRERFRYQPRHRAHRHDRTGA